MRWSNVKLILAREIRDQLRDRRTLFMIVVLPLLLYPFLGMSFIQISQFAQKQASKVFVIGANRLPEKPPLIENNHFAPNLYSSPNQIGSLELEFASDELAPGETFDDVVQRAREKVESGQYDAAIYFPPDFADRLERFRQASAARDQAPEAHRKKSLPGMPQPEIIYTTANDKSRSAFGNLHQVLSRWTDEIGKANLSAAGLPSVAARPFEVRTADLAKESGQAGAGFWARLLPVMLVLWALTGAFYPAVDLCAGEKERGTLETLLSSPAQRTEIVVGKLVTIILFSMTTAILNLVAMGMTGWLVMHNLPADLEMPSLLSILWLIIALIPIAALFSALCLALAALARSTKEGQYYLMPLMLICMPLAILPMTPGVELTLGNSLVPVTNVVLLLRALLENHYWEALRFAAPVVGVTLLCCLLAIRWAVDQFNQESVLFRESERLDMGRWLGRLFHDRRPTPSVAMALMCGCIILLLKFVLSRAMSFDGSFMDFFKMAIVTQLVVVAAPALIMTFTLTSNAAQTLLLDRRSWRFASLATVAAIALAVAVHPVAILIQSITAKLYPIPEVAKEISRLMGQAPDFFTLLLIVAILPPICEELAFRGFILSGLRHSGRKWRAIIITALFFGLTHGILHQEIVATLVGVILGYIAVQSGNLLPCIAYHMVHNSLVIALGHITPEILEKYPLLDRMLDHSKDSFGYHWAVIITGGVLAAMILTWFARLPYRKTDEEELQDAIRRGIEADDEPLASTAG